MRARTITTSERDPSRREVSVWLPVRSSASFDELVQAIMAELSAGAVGAYIELCIPSSAAELRAVESGDVAPGQAWVPPETPAPRVEPGPVLMPREDSTIEIDEDDEEEEEENEEDERAFDDETDSESEPSDSAMDRPLPDGPSDDAGPDLQPRGDYVDVLVDDFGPGDDEPDDEESLDFEPEDGGEDEGDLRDEPVIWDENEEPPEDSGEDWEDYDFDSGPDFGEGAEDYEA